ncbi:winged helix DNA-binding domain-containing protein [Gammaproteobacteria bacterium]|nr:winged helix DNA-binding domain-containing protein [Gammaproteobacteria bacterium]
MEITQSDARKLFLKQQGLLRTDEFGRGKNGTNKAIQRLSYVQIDTISVINRAHEHILYNRVSNYNPTHLEKLVREREVFEYWSHAAAFLPFKDFRYCLPVMNGFRNTRHCDEKLKTEVLARIRAEGPLQSRDFEDTSARKRGGWWEWKPAKRVLEHLFFSGELMVTRREGFQKIFDLTENVIPSSANTSEPTLEEWTRFIVLGMVHALGIATEYDVGYAKPIISRLSKISLRDPLRATLSGLVAEGELLEVNVQGRTCYTTGKLLGLLPVRSNRQSVRLLSPFDNLVINRRRTRELFGFDYLLECYVPAAKRKYGYFSLPLLYGDSLVGRLDAKAHRKHHQLQVNNLVLEPHVKVEDQLIQALAHGIAKLANDHECHSCSFQQATPNTLVAPLKAAIKKIL